MLIHRLLMRLFSEFCGGKAINGKCQTFCVWPDLWRHRWPRNQIFKLYLTMSPPRFFGQKWVMFGSQARVIQKFLTFALVGWGVDLTPPGVFANNSETKRSNVTKFGITFPWSTILHLLKKIVEVISGQVAWSDHVTRPPKSLSLCQSHIF